MAIITNTFQTYQAVGIREGLSDTIYRISPEETPLMSNLGQSTQNTVYDEWQNDSLAAPNLSNKAVEGDEFAYAAVTPTVRLANYAQISTKQVIVSNRMQVVNKAGRKDELGYQMALKSAELKRDMESIMSQNQVAAPGATGTASQSAGFESFLRTNDNRGASGVDPVLSGTTQGYPTTAPVDGTQRAFTEVILKDIAVKQYNAGGKATMLLVGPAQKQVVSGFAGIAQQRRDTGDQAAVIVGAADVYVSDFGRINVVPSRFNRNRTALLIDPNFAEVSYLRPFRVVTPAVTGDAEKRVLIVDWMLRVTHEAAHAVAADLT